jgi:hypothetical protein
MTDIEVRLTRIEDALIRAGISIDAPAQPVPEIMETPLEELPVAEIAGNGTLFSDFAGRTKLSHTWLCSECARENYTDDIFVPSTQPDGVNFRLKCSCGTEYQSGRRFRDPVRALAWVRSQETGKPFDQCHQEEKVAAMLFNRR